MIIYNKTGTQIADITPSDQSTRTRTTTKATINLIFQYPGSLTIPVGSYITFEETMYTLRRPAVFVKNGERNYEYTMELISQPGPDKYMVKDVTTKRLKFSLTARPEEFLQMIIDNLNQRETGWEVGEYLSAKERLVQFNHNTITEALTAIAEAFSTEYEIVGKTISLRKIEYNKSNPVALSYGGDYGFTTGIRRENYDNSIPTEILHIQGGDRNLTLATYGAKELLLPKNQTIGYDGSKFQDEEGYQVSLARTYITDADGLTIRRQDKVLNTMEENSLDLSDIYPSRVGTITSVVEVDQSKNLYDIIDAGIPENLDFDECLIPGEAMTIKFQSGMLVGKEFECNYTHATRRFEIVPQDIDGQTMPNEIYGPVIGDEYIILGIQLPEAYISDDTTKSGASWDLFREGVRHLYENEDDRFTFSGELDPIWYRLQHVNIGSRIVPGGYISFSDTQFQTTPVLIRIASVKDHLNDPYLCTLDLSNVAVGAGNVRNELVKLTTGEVKAKDETQDSIRFFKRRFRDTSETMAMLQAGLLNFSEAINPVTIQTMQLIAGDKSLQFRFVNSKITPVKHTFTSSYNQETKVFSSQADILQHMTIGITTVSSVRTVSEYSFWDIGAFTSSNLSDPTKAYWIYAKCSAINNTGTIILSETPIGISDVANYYHFLIGILNSEYENDRSFVQLYGFTEVLPGQITTDKIQSSDAELVIDLVNKFIKGSLKFTSGDDVETAVNAAASAAGEAQTYIVETINPALSDLQNQIDGVVDSWFYPYSPTSGNFPAGEWTSDELMNKHIGDTFTNTQEYVDDTTTPDAGKSWRWVYSDTLEVHYWTPIADSDAVKALLAASQAQDTADGKRRVFTAQPTNAQAYDVGDLWAKATYGTTYINDLLKCKTGKIAGAAFSIDHWEPASEAQANAKLALEKITDIVSDGVLSAAEKPSQRQAWDVIAAEKEGIDTQATAFSITTEKTTYDDAFQALATYLNDGVTWSSGVPSWLADANLGLNTSINGSTYRSNWKAYYDARTTLQNLVTTKAKAAADAYAFLKEAMSEDSFKPNGVDTSVLWSKLFLMRDSLGNQTGGMSGLSSDNVASWSGGTYQDALDSATTPSKVANIDRKDGSGHRAFGNILWDLLGNLLLNADVIGKLSTAAEGKRIEIDPATGSINMYDTLERIVLTLQFNEWNDGAWDWSTSKLTLNAYTQTNTTPYYYVTLSSNGIDAWQGTTLMFRIRMTNGAPVLMFDIATFPTAGGYVGQVYRSGDTLKIKVT